MKKIADNLHYNPARRRFIKQTAMVGTAVGMLSPMGKAFGSLTPSGGRVLMSNPIGFNGERRDPVTGCYHLGNGYRMYNPGLMRFHAADSMSPFGKGGLNSYAYCLGDPVNQRDPSGHFALMTLLIGAIIGAVVGAAISAAAEGIQSAINPEHEFDWKQVGIGAALGFISGGFGAAAKGAKTSVQVGLAIGEAVVSGGADFGLNVAAGTPIKQAGINAGIGAIIGLGAFGAGHAIGRLRLSKSLPIGEETRGPVRGRKGNPLTTLNSKTPIGYHGTSVTAGDALKNTGPNTTKFFLASSYISAKHYAEHFSPNGTVLKVFSNDISVLRNTSSWRPMNAANIAELVVQPDGFKNLSFEGTRRISASSFSGEWVRMGLKTQEESLADSILAFRAQYNP